MRMLSVMFIKQQKIITLAFLITYLTSCDYTMNVAVRNYKRPCRVNITYQKSIDTFFDNDTLLFSSLDSRQFDSSLLRFNTSANSYYFIAPSNKEITLHPKSIGNPIEKVEIFDSSDSSWTINLWDRKEIRRLKRSGLIKTKGFLFTTSIFIENK